MQTFGAFVKHRLEKVFRETQVYVASGRDESLDVNYSDAINFFDQRPRRPRYLCDVYNGAIRRVPPFQGFPALDFLDRLSFIPLGKRVSNVVRGTGSFRIHVSISLIVTTSQCARIIPLPKELKYSFPHGVMHIPYAPTCSIYMHRRCVSRALSAPRPAPSFQNTETATKETAGRSAATQLSRLSPMPLSGRSHAGDPEQGGRGGLAQPGHHGARRAPPASQALSGRPDAGVARRRCSSKSPQR
jgi:hypothetical protein